MDIKQKADPIVADFKSKGETKSLFKMLLPKLGLVLALVVVVIIVVVVIEVHRDNEPRTGVCSTSLINQALHNMNSNDLKGVSANADTIMKLSGYKWDPNCMYIMTVYYLDMSNPTKAQNSLDQLNKVNKNNLNSSLLKYRTLSQLSQEIHFVTLNIQAIDSNSAKFSPPSIHPKTGPTK